MKKYLIITYDVCNMGGGQLFVLRRANHLRKIGYDVSIVVTYHTDYFPLEEQFKGYPLYLIPEMGIPSVKFSKKKICKIITDLLNKIGDSTDLLIESHTLTTIDWAELVASRCGAKHLAYPLAEPKVSEYRFNPGLKIFESKLKRGEFYGCTSTSLKEIFDRDNLPANYINIGYDENEMFDKCEPAIEVRKESGVYIITTVTRLDKTYVEPLIDNTALLANKYPQQKFILLIAGGSKTPGREEYLKSKYCNEVLKIPNLNIVYTGYIEKLGKDIFEVSDVFVGMGTAVINAISLKCVTLNIDPRDGMQYTSGFFGIDTNNFAYSESGKVYKIVDKLEEAYLMKEVDKQRFSMIGRKLYEEEFKYDTCMRKLDNAINSLKPVSEESIPNVPCLYRIYVYVGTMIKKVLAKSFMC